LSTALETEPFFPLKSLWNLKPWLANCLAKETSPFRGSTMQTLPVKRLTAVLLPPSGAMVLRWLSADAIKPWQYRSWIFLRDSEFAQKAGRVLDLYQGFWNGKLLRPNDYVISSDEKTSIQARNREGLHKGPGPSQYQRAGALAYIAAWDVRRSVEQKSSVYEQKAPASRFTINWLIWSCSKRRIVQVIVYFG